MLSFGSLRRSGLSRGVTDRCFQLGMADTRVESLLFPHRLRSGEAAESALQLNCSFEVGSFVGQVASIRAACRSGYAPLFLVVLGTLSNIAVT